MMFYIVFFPLAFGVMVIDKPFKSYSDHFIIQYCPKNVSIIWVLLYCMCRIRSSNWLLQVCISYLTVTCDDLIASHAYTTWWVGLFWSVSSSSRRYWRAIIYLPQTSLSSGVSCRLYITVMTGIHDLNNRFHEMIKNQNCWSMTQWYVTNLESSGPLCSGQQILSDDLVINSYSLFHKVVLYRTVNINSSTCSF